MASIIKVDQIQESTTGVGTNFSNTGSATTPTISIGNQTNKGLYHLANDKIGVSVGGQRVGEIGNGYGGFTGNIIQVQSTVKSNPFTLNSTTTFTDIPGLNVTVIPKYNTSKILIICHIGCVSTASAGGASIFRFMRNSTAVGIGDAESSRLRAGFRTSIGYNGDHGNATSMTFLDSPSSTSSLVYTVEMACEFNTTINGTISNSDGANTYQARHISTITVMELQQ